MIQYRRVVNDAVAFNWEDMPEITNETVQGLYEYLDSCEGTWSGEMLHSSSSWDKRVIDYGYRGQFKFSRTITEEELTWLENKKESLVNSLVKCICGGTPAVREDIAMLGAELSHFIMCSCGLRYADVHMHLTKSQAINGWNKIFSKIN